MRRIRQPAVAGMFYPKDPNELRTAVREFLEHVSSDINRDTAVPKAIIAPHAGYVYSGAIAASAYAYVAKLADTITRVVLIGPSHRVPLYGFATSSADMFATPLGNIPLDHDVIRNINRLPSVKVMDDAHALEHSLEVHLPFLQLTLHEFSLVPIVAGDASPQQVNELLNAVWGGRETLIVISSDLSHYNDYQHAVRIDRKTCDDIESLNLNNIHSQQACGYVPVRGMLYTAKDRNLRVKTVDYRNSGDTAGSKDRVVGYGSYVITCPR